MQPRLKLRRPSIAAISAVVVATIAGEVRAQSAEAEQLFTDGNKYMADGKLAEACDAFEASNRIEPRAGTLIRLGECREQRHELASAWSAYKDSLTRVKDKHKREVATKRAAALEPRLSYLTIQIGERADGLAITRDDKPVDAGLWNRATPIDGGDYVITARAAGRVDWRTTIHVPAESGKIVVEVPKLANAPTTVSTLDTAVTTSVASRAPAPASPLATSRFTLQRKLSLGVAGVAVASAALGIVLGEMARSKEHDAFALCPDQGSPCASAASANSLLKTGRTRALESNIGFGVAGALAVGAAVLWFTGAPRIEHRGIAFVPHVSADQVGIVLAGRL